MGARGPQPGRPEMPLRSDRSRQLRFLARLRETGNYREAARHASPHSEHGCVSSFKSFARDSAFFAAEIGEALADFRESLVAEAVRRGRDGYDRPVYQRGELVGHERVFSDHLLTLELKKHHSEYREKVQHDHRVRIEPMGSWAISVDDLQALSAEQREQLRGIMVTIRNARREHRAIEDRSNVVDAEYAEVTAEADGDWHTPDEPIPF